MQELICAQIIPFCLSAMTRPRGTTFSIRPIPPGSETPAMSQAAIYSSALLPPGVASPLSTGAVSRRPVSAAISARSTSVVSRLCRVWIAERCAALMSPPTAWIRVPKPIRDSTAHITAKLPSTPIPTMDGGLAWGRHRTFSPAAETLVSYFRQRLLTPQNQIMGHPSR